jgi:hypothetical protein
MANQVLYGFYNLKDLFARRVTEVGVSEIATAIQQSVDEHNRQVDALLGLFCRRITDFKLRYRTPTTARLQPLDENGRALPIKAAGQYDVSWPLQMAGSAWGANFVTLAKMRVEEANDMTAAMLSADARWIRDHILAALFVENSWTYADPAHGDLSVYGPASGDSTIYQILGGADVGATDDHMLATASAISDSANPLPALATELLEHPENGGQVIALVPSNLRADFEALSTFFAAQDPNIRTGSNTDVLVGGLGVAVPGDRFGYADGVHLVEWRSMPSNYVIAVTSQGERALAMREDEETELRGFKQVAERNDHPFYERQWMRRAGFGAWNRTGVVVERFGNASYAAPTGYESPMP